MKEQLIQFWNEQVKPRLKKAWHEFSLFVTSMFFLKNLAAIVGALILLTFLTFKWLKCYTHHGESLQVHNYIGMPLDDAAKKARSGSFRIVVNDSVWVEGKAPGMVMEQDPKPLSRVKENRTIYLTVTKWTEYVTLPSLVGTYDYNQYKKKLTRRSIRSAIRERVIDNKQAENTILHLYHKGEKITEDDLKEGIRIPKGSTVEVVVTERGGGFVNLPNLVCRRFSEAEFLITSLELTIGKVWEDPTVTDRSTAYIYKQNPPYSETGGAMRVGQQVELFLTQELPLGCAGD